MCSSHVLAVVVLGNCSLFYAAGACSCARLLFCLARGTFFDAGVLRQGLVLFFSFFTSFLPAWSDCCAHPGSSSFLLFLVLLIQRLGSSHPLWWWWRQRFPAMVSSPCCRQSCRTSTLWHGRSMRSKGGAPSTRSRRTVLCAELVKKMQKRIQGVSGIVC